MDALKVKETKIWEREHAERMITFSDLLSTIKTIDEKEKTIWKEVYNNAITDYEEACACFHKAMFSIISQTKNEEAFQQLVIANKLISDLLTRREKSNAQLIKLIEMLQAIKATEAAIDENSMFDRLDEIRNEVG